MTEEQVEEQIETIRKITKEMCKSKKKARKFLRDAGIPVGDEPYLVMNLLEPKRESHA